MYIVFEIHVIIWEGEGESINFVHQPKLSMGLGPPGFGLTIDFSTNNYNILGGPV